MTRGIQHVLLVGPDDDVRRALHVVLDQLGPQVAAVGELAEARDYLAGSAPCDAVISVESLAIQLAEATAVPVIAVVASRDLAPALRLLDAGVADLVVEPVTEPVDALALALALRHVASLPRPAARLAAPALIGDGARMAELRQMIERIGATRSTVLVLGESGTGKELVARALHDASPRRDRRFVAVNCAAIPASLLESELFGHRRGAFTDAVRDRAGLFEDADGGTLFLDEIGELPLALQAKLLRVLQDGELRRVGDTQPIQVDVRLIAATLRDLAEEVREGRFREDLFYRLNVLPIDVPPLRERPEDIPQLARWFARRHAQRHGLGEIELSDDAVAALAAQPWPGNVRELENAVERAVVLADGPAGGTRVLDAGYLASVLGLAPAAEAPASSNGGVLSIKQATRDIEQALIRRALGQTQGNRTNAAKLLEISHRALLYKMKEYGIT